MKGVDLRGLHRAPGVTRQARGQGGVAVDDLAVHGDGGAHAPEAVAQRRLTIHVERRGGCVPECGQEATLKGCLHRSRGHLGANLALQPQGVVADAVALFVRRGGRQRAIDEAGQRVHRRAIGMAGHEHQREVVAQGGEIVMPGQEGRAQAKPLHGLQVPPVAAAGEEERDVRVGGRFHGYAWVLASRGHTVSLSSSALSPALVTSADRSATGRSRSS